ncbi:MAG: homoserine kinase [Elusimicrobia bacterium]|nr:homoserine kinase [Elusimicrobiota bacterium]
MKTVLVRVPASSGNLGAGFDVLGLALKLYDTLWVQRKKGRGLQVSIAGEGAQELPRNRSNLVVRTFSKILGPDWNRYAWSFEMKNQIPLKKGLGSSAAARLAAMAAANAFLKKPLSQEELLKRAALAEGHADNVVAAHRGGMCASLWSNRELRYFSIRPPSHWIAAVCLPDRTLSTPKSRAVLPKKVRLQDAVSNLMSVAGFLYGFLRRDAGWLTRGMQDRLHQPYRQKLIPGLSHVCKSAVRAGAFGSALSGAGPSVLGLCSRPKGPQVGVAMVKAFRKFQIPSRFLLLEIDREGLQVSQGRVR